MIRILFHWILPFALSLILMGGALYGILSVVRIIEGPVLSTRLDVRFDCEESPHVHFDYLEGQSLLRAQVVLWNPINNKWLDPSCRRLFVGASAKISEAVLHGEYDNDPVTVLDVRPIQEAVNMPRDNFFVADLARGLHRRVRFTLHDVVLDKGLSGSTIAFTLSPFIQFTDTFEAGIDVTDFQWPTTLTYSVHIPDSHRSVLQIPSPVERRINLRPSMKYRAFRFNIDPRRTDFLFEVRSNEIRFREYALILLSTLLGAGVSLFIQLFVTGFQTAGASEKQEASTPLQPPHSAEPYRKEETERDEVEPVEVAETQPQDRTR